MDDDKTNLDEIKEENEIIEGEVASESPVSEEGTDISQAAAFLNLEELIKNHIEAIDKLKADLVKLRYFAGLTNEEVAEVLGISLSTTKNYWAFSRAWLLNEIEGESEE